MGSTVGVGVVGTGIMALQHAAVLNALPDVEVVAWVSRTSRTCPLGTAARVVNSVSDLVSHHDVDAVVIATPDFAHRDAAVTALGAGKPVAVEKPLATTARDAYAIRDASRAAGVPVLTLYNHRWIPAYWQARQACGDAALGQLVIASARKNDTITVPTSMIGWADQTSPSLFLSSHDLDLILWMTGERVVSVVASAVRSVLRSNGVDTPDAVLSQLTLGNGAVVHLEACWTYPDTFPTTTDSFVELVFERGVLHLPRVSEAVELCTSERYSYPRNQLLSWIGGVPRGSVASALQHFVDCLRTGTTPLVDLDASVHVTEVLAAIERSWRTGDRVTLDEETPA